jgi:hypothetical protein
MPRKNHRLIQNKDKKELAILLEELVSCVEKSGGLRSFSAVDRQLIENLFSFYKRISELTHEEVNLVWETAKMVVEKLTGKDHDTLIDEKRSDDHKEDVNALEGKYWILPDRHKYLKCDDHVLFAKSNQQEFVDGLGLDTSDFIHALSSGETDVIPLILAAGGIMAVFSKEHDQKVASFRLCQCSVQWLKSKLSSMPIFKSYIHMLDPHAKYSDDTVGIQFIYRRPRNPLIRTEQEDGA